MALDRPWFAAGPGNFQSIYERYRELSANEQIAEPHNFFVETLASGGFVGAGLLATSIVIGFRVMLRRMREFNPFDQQFDEEAINGTLPFDADSHCVADANSSNLDRDRWVWLGAGLAFLLIWLIGWATFFTPDTSAGIYVVPSAVVAAIALWRSGKRIGSRELDSIVGVLTITIFVHLLVSGGWTVPGVAAVLWIMTGLLTRQPSPTVPSVPSPQKNESGLSLSRNAVIAGTVVLGTSTLILLYFGSLAPVQARTRFMDIAAYAQSKGQTGRARSALEKAAASDPWSPDAVLWQADMERHKMIREENDTTHSRKQWESLLEESKKRGGDNPALYRMVGAQQIHLFQRFGRPKDLEAAETTFEKAVSWSPANQWMIAQLSVIRQARGDLAEAAKLRERASQIAALGANIERDLSKQLLYNPKPIGKLADQGPLRQSASEMFQRTESSSSP
jgi:hypothetical protein